MSKRTTSLLLEDMLLAGERIGTYTKDMSYSEFIADVKTTDATVRNIQILGEAASQIPKDFQAQYPDIEWSKIIRSRHILVHAYFELDYAIIWQIVNNYLPPLTEKLRIIVKK